MAPDKLLGIYLNDHLAGATIGYEVARRSANNNRGTQFEPFLRRLVQDLEEDRTSLEDLMARLGVAKNPIKTSTAWAAEKVGRLKLNGRVTGYSPLSRLEELEGLVLGVRGKLGLWRLLKELRDLDARLATYDLDRLIERAEAQYEELERHRIQAAEKAFARSSV